MNNPTPRLARCAIYSRKSTEDKLDLAFTSPDAQWEACEAYIHSEGGARDRGRRNMGAGARLLQQAGTRGGGDAAVLRSDEGLVASFPGAFEISCFARRSS
jgi:hypothetical protein